MTECEEVAANMAPHHGRLSYDEAMTVVKQQMPDETATIRCNVAWALHRVTTVASTEEG